jgi:hypothetical protein
MRPAIALGASTGRSTARRDRLIVKEFELDPMADIWIIPDMAVCPRAQRRPAPDSSFPLWMRVKEYQLPEATEEYVR